jgi:GAF domain-containing protein
MVDATNAVVHIPDAAQLSKGGNREYDTAVELGGVRTCLAVPMLKGHELIGSISLFRQKVRRFNDKQIASLTNFAAQAVIAIENARLLSELRGALERQTATSEVLQAISSSPGDLEPVFATMLENAIRICDAKFGNIYRAEGDGLRNVATHNTPTAFAEALRSSPYLRPGPRNPVRRMINTKTIIHVVDVRATEAYAEREPIAVASVELGGTRTLMIVPMLKDNELVGAFTLARQEVRPFTDKQIALVQNFAAQAVIAIENARLLNELRQRTTDLTERTADLTEALEQQTATSEVLQVISGSPSDLQPVFATMLEKAVRICDATFGNVYRWDGEALHLVATRNTPPAFAEARRRSLGRRDDKNQMLALILANKKPLHVADAAALPGYINRSDLAAVQTVELGGVRSLLGVPMLKEGELIGGFTVYRQEVRPFTDKQIELVKNFAAQAVIAIENARLLNELRQSLEQQTATSEVLQVISSSPGDLQPVFATMLEKAVRICDAKFGTLYLYEEGGLRLLAAHDVPAAFEDVRGGSPIPPAPGGLFDEVIKTGTTVHLPDMATTKPYAERHPRVVEAVELGGIRTVVAVPMLKENELIGIFSIHRREVRPFTDKQIALVTNFAAQAVIAIENARLLNELRQRTTDLTEALEQQTATSEVLRVISGSSGHVQPVFEAVLANAVRLCDAKFGTINRWDGEALHLVASYNVPLAFAEFRRRTPFHPGPDNPISRMLTSKMVIHFDDFATAQDYLQRNPHAVAAVELGGVRTFLAVPMLKESNLIGVVIAYRQEVRPFSDKQIELLKNFAAQAVIAVEDARLLNELRERTDQLEAQSQELANLNQQLEQRVTDQVDEIERMGRLRRFLPPQVADLIVASGTEKQLESHRREITALFCDLRGFTGFTESADAEDVMALLRDYHAAIGEIIIKYNGTLERYAGDGVMVIFNDPVPVENPALQAVLMALEVREAIGALTETWRRWGHDIGFGIGIAHGFATLGTIGFEGRFDYAAIGTVSNVASRLCDEAKPGQILISPRVLTKVENAVKVEPVGEFELKGIRRPLAAYNVVAAIASRD